jgi:hypothetical protein
VRRPVGFGRRSTEATREANPPAFDPAIVADLPEVAQRYFACAILPGTALHRVVSLDMSGTFILNGTEMPMTAHQIVAPPALGFLWKAEIGAGLMRLGGSDGYHRVAGTEESWTKFWPRGLIPLARVGATQDHARAATSRLMLEAVWAPASLPAAVWCAVGPDGSESGRGPLRRCPRD